MTVNRDNLELGRLIGESSVPRGAWGSRAERLRRTTRMSWMAHIKAIARGTFPPVPGSHLPQGARVIGQVRKTPKTACPTNFFLPARPAGHSLPDGRLVRLTRPRTTVSTNRIKCFMHSAAPRSRRKKPLSGPP